MTSSVFAQGTAQLTGAARERPGGVVGDAAPPRQAGVVAVIGGLIAVVAAAAWWPDARWAPVSALTVVVLLRAAVVDLVEHRLPNRIVFAAAVPVAAGVVLTLAVGSDAWTGAAAGAAVVGVPLFATHLVSPAGLGFGDVKAGVVLGGGVGGVSPTIAAAGLMLALIVSAAWALARRRRAVPLGPGMVGGAILALAAARVVGVQAW